MADTTLDSNVVIDVGEASFQRDVIQRSHQVPVVVDFWAAWCGPCRTLGPILEGLAREFEGRFILAKLNTDQNQRLAMQFGIQGIPAVKAFVDGRIVAEFVGAQPRPVVRQFIERLLPNSTDQAIGQVRALIASGHFGQAQQMLDALLAQDPDHAEGLLVLAELQSETGDIDSAAETLGRVPAATPAGKRALQLLAKVQLQQAAAKSGAPSLATLKAQVAENPNDMVVRYQLAAALAASGALEEALAHYLVVVQQDRSIDDDGARRAMLNIFTMVGDTALSRDYRNRLASALFT